jgi:hypothetical protein
MAAGSSLKILTPDPLLQPLYYKEIKMSDQLTCPLCAQSVAHTLIPHLRAEHKIEPEVFRRALPGAADVHGGLSRPSWPTARSTRRGDILHYEARWPAAR